MDYYHQVYKRKSWLMVYYYFGIDRYKEINVVDIYIKYFDK
jgi:hypothetical protein